jgi:hypothetical protein
MNSEKRYVRFKKRMQVIGLPLGLAVLIAPAWTGSAQADQSSSVTHDPHRRIVETDMTEDPSRMNGQPQIAVNPRHPNNLVFMATDDDLKATDFNLYKCILAHSNNGGMSWTRVNFPYGDSVGCGNPQLTVDQQGIFYVGFNLLGGTAPQVMGVARSVDGGRTWSAPVATPLNFSASPRLTVDKATDHLYAEASVQSGGAGTGGPQALSVSKDHGLTWGPMVPLPAEAWQGFGDNIAAGHGELATATTQAVVNNGTSVTTVKPTFTVTSDNGRHWTTTPVTDSSGNQVAPPEGDLLIPSPTTYFNNTDPVPWVASDPTHRGRFAVMVPRNENLEVYITADSGKRWRGPAVIAAPNAFKPAIAFGPTGALGVMWRTTGVDAYSAVSFDRGRSFSRPVRVNATTEPAGTRSEGGDKHSQIVLTDHYAYITWSDGRTGGDVDAVLGRVPLSLYRHGG